MNTFTVVGRIYKDLELRYTPSNSAILDLPIAVNNGKDDTTFLTTTVFGLLAENTAKYCKKGSLVGVKGIIKNHNWEDKNGNKHYDYTFLADKVTFLSNNVHNDNKPKEKSDSEIIADVMNNKDPFEDFGDSIEVNDNFLD